MSDADYWDTEPTCTCVETARGTDTFGCELHDPIAPATVLTQDQLRSMLAEQASQIGLTVDDVVELALHGELPKTDRGSEIELLVGMLHDHQPPAAGRAGESGGGR